MVSLKSLDSLIKENNRENSVIYANEVGNAVLDIFSEAVAVSKTMNNQFIQKLFRNDENLTDEQITEQIRKYLAEITVKFGYSTAFLMNERTMTYYAEKGFTKTVDPSNPDDDWYEPFKESGKAYELNVDNDQANNNRMTIYINTRMLDQSGNFIGVCGVGMPVRQVVLILQTMEIQSDISIKLVAPDGNVRVGRTGQIVMQRTEDELKELIKEYDYSEPYFYKLRDADGYTIIKYIPECQWFAVIDCAAGRTTIFSTMLFKNLMVCLFILLAVLVVVNFVLGRFAQHTQKFVEEALEDQLTGLKNRRAYQAELEKINAKGNLDSVSVVSMDINGLKHTNDSFGHTAGDDLLRGASAIMKNIFVNKGWKVFRTGGDEFIALTDQVADEGSQIIQEFKDELAKFKHSQIKELSVSIGVAQGSKNKVTTIEELVKVADKRMYADKELFYSDESHERRRR